MRPQRRRKAQWDGGKVRALRQHLGLTQAEMAEELGARQQTISEWEVGMYRPRGPSATLLSIVAERAGFRYEAGGAAPEGEAPPASEGGKRIDQGSA